MLRSGATVATIESVRAVGRVAAFQVIELEFEVHRNGTKRQEHVRVTGGWDCHDSLLHRLAAP